jgi:Ca-activated chloride channel homolog
VGLGQDVNRAYLEKVALNAGGKSYFLKDPSGLEQILLKDVKEHTGSTAVERPVRAKAVREAEILEQVEIDKAPPLAGYVKYTAKPAADLLLTVDDREPLYVRWQYGLGRAAVFTSDAKSRWAASWVGWDGFGKLWANIFRDLLPRAQPGEASADFDRVQNELIVRYRLAPGMPDPKAPPTLFAFGPAGFQKVVPVTKLSAGLYQGKLPIGSRRGFFRVRALQDSLAFPEVGMYRQEEELHDYGSNPALLQHIAEYTGGRFEPAPAQIFQDGRAFPAQMRLWPALLALAVLMGMVELLVRKWPGVWQTLFARRSPAPQSAA